MRKGYPEAMAFIFMVEVMPILPLWLIRFVSYLLFAVAYPFVIIFGLNRRFVRNINAALGNERSKREIAAIARQAVYIQIIGVMEVTHYFHPKRREELLENVKVIGIEKVAEARSGGMGAIGLTAHLGNFQLMGVRLGAEKDLNFWFLVKDPRVTALTNAWYRYMDKIDLNRLNFTERTDVAKIVINRLNQSAFVMMVADEHKRRGIKADFFGKETRMAAGPAVISLRTGAKLLPMFIVREKKSRYTLYIEDPIDFTPTGDREGDVEALTQLRTEVLERYVRKYPGQWLWLHSHWKRG
ncbi:MAG: lysophospholipid acyltransferase family protein [Deltaproteobacteria bacterium]|uniref:Lysophospholipid acyltransferase family protein n=1 Tax=Candidatus Zymogenus saltonus TaxID=2844893 RepID=A0A9D8KF08_9DELT|nr:lysophospholipid acyltransferase family protein [Candidatus Zymogenus saltonus]